MPSDALFLHLSPHQDQQGKLAMKYGVRFTLNISHASSALSQFQVRALPTVIAFKGGEAVSRFVGVIPELKLTEFLESVSAQENEV